jgi:hypothetical protein
MLADELQWTSSLDTHLHGSDVMSTAEGL